ncbi:hypothetical protein V8F20_002341 [Naviculisporaceae sp. PSN 640]
MAPLIPRMHLFEIHDQEWFPAFLRAKVQAALTVAWMSHIPVIQPSSPANAVARLLSTQLKSSIRDYVFIDFCAGAGGPTPAIEKHLNSSLASSSQQPVQFVLTDLHPHTESWILHEKNSPNLSYVPYPVDASDAPPHLIQTYKSKGKKTFRLFNLAFHHFDDPLAKAILRNTLQTSDGFGIFELQGRDFSGFITCALFGIGIMLSAPIFAWKWRSPLTLVFTYLLPILPFVLVWDGWMSSLRTRTPEEVEALMRTCGAEGDIAESWEVRSGVEQLMWPCGELRWIVCVKKEK